MDFVTLLSERRSVRTGIYYKEIWSFHSEYIKMCTIDSVSFKMILQMDFTRSLTEQIKFNETGLSLSKSA